MDAHHADNAATIALGAACATYEHWLPSVAAIHSAAEDYAFWAGVALATFGLVREAVRAVRWVRAR